VREHEAGGQERSLLEERERQSEIPDCIDAIVPLGETEELLKKIEELLNPGQAKSRAGS